MWGYDNSNSDSSSYNRVDASEIIKQIKDLKNKGYNITITESKKLVELQEKLYKAQEKCTHFWSVVLLFNRHSRFCRFCDKEDVTYKHDN